MMEYGYKRAVCFSCGNATEKLKQAGVDVLAIAPNGDLVANKWFTIGEVANRFTGYFDATSGHLPMDLMKRIAARYRETLGELTGDIYVPCGSGESLVCLKLAYPDVNFIAVYNLDSATEYGAEAPLNDLVKLLAKDVIYEPEEEEWLDLTKK